MTFVFITDAFLWVILKVELVPYLSSKIYSGSLKETEDS